jgi:hypothetical protein
MPELILREEFHLSFFIPADQAESEDNNPIGEVLDSESFQADLLHAVLQVVQKQPVLRDAAVELSR